MAYYCCFKNVFCHFVRLLAPRIKRARSFRSISYGVTLLTLRPMQAFGILIQVFFKHQAFKIGDRLPGINQQGGSNHFIRFFRK